MRKVGVHTLNLVCEPFSNQMGEWLWQDGEVNDLLSSSKLYFIGQREEVLIQNMRSNLEANTLTFDLVTTTDSIRDVVFHINQLQIPEGDLYYVDAGERYFRIRHGHEGDETQWPICHWFTPDRLMFYYWQGRIKVENLQDFRKFTRFALYYVGISTKGDSFSRLFATAHEKRSRIMGNETQFVPTARLTDELMLFLFKVEDLNVITYDGNETDEELDSIEDFINPATLAADAEKAFVKMTNAKYNTQKYAAYPISSDGLWNQKWDGYGYGIAEPLTFVSGETTFNGGRMFEERPWPYSDVISISGETIEIIPFSRPRS